MTTTGTARLAAIEAEVQECFKAADRKAAILKSKAALSKPSSSRPAARILAAVQNASEDPKSDIATLSRTLRKGVDAALAKYDVVEDDGTNLLAIADYIVGERDQLPVGVGTAEASAAICLRGHVSAPSVATAIRNAVQVTLDEISRRKAELAPRTKSAAACAALNHAAQLFAAYGLHRHAATYAHLHAKKMAQHSAMWRTTRPSHRSAA